MLTTSVLIVEDDDLISSFICRALIKLGHSVASASTGEDALERLTTGSIDLVLLDLTLPDIDGLEVLRRLRATGSAVPVVVLTSRSDPKDRAAAVSLGANRYLVKPFPLADLVEVVAAIRSS